MEELIFLALIGLTAGTVKGLSGFGSSLVAIPLLNWLYGNEYSMMITIMLITFNVILNSILMFENKAFSIKSLKNVWIITLFGAIFTIIGLGILQNMDGTVITYIAASLIFFSIVVKVYNLYSKNPLRIKPRYITQAIVGTLSGLGNGISSIDGPPVVFYLSGIDAKKEQFKNTLATHFLVMGIIGVITILLRGMYTTEILLNSLYISLFCSIGVVGGIFISKKINEKTFQLIVLGILVLLDIKMIFF